MLTIEIAIKRGDTTLLQFKNNAAMTLRWIAQPGACLVDKDQTLSGFIFRPYSDKNTATVLEEIKEQLEIEISTLKERQLSL